MKLFSLQDLNKYYTHRNSLFTLLLVVSVMVLLFANLSFAMGAKIRPGGKGIYFYNDKDLSGFFTNIGYPEFWEEVEITSTKSDGSTFSFPSRHIEISRNSNGSALRFLNVNTRKFLVVSCDGVIKEIDAPPSRQVWLNDDNQIVLWRDGSAGIVHYKDGTIEKTHPFSSNGADLSGRYFYKNAPHSHNIPLVESCKSEIYSIEKPSLPLTEVNICSFHKIFSKDNKVFLFGREYLEGDNKIKDSMTAYIFQMKDEKLVEAERLNIIHPSGPPSLFQVVDLSPWDNEVLFIDPYDLPQRDRLYSFNLKTLELKKIGYVPFSGGWHFYLQCDILKNTLEKRTSKK